MNTDLKNVIALTAGGSFTAITFQSQNKTTYINQEYYICSISFFNTMRLRYTTWNAIFHQTCFAMVKNNGSHEISDGTIVPDKRPLPATLIVKKQCKLLDSANKRGYNQCDYWNCRWLLTLFLDVTPHSGIRFGTQNKGGPKKCQWNALALIRIGCFLDDYSWNEG